MGEMVTLFFPFFVFVSYLFTFEKSVSQTNIDLKWIKLIRNV